MADLQAQIASLTESSTLEYCVRVCRPLVEGHRETCTICPPPFGKVAIVTGDNDGSSRATAAAEKESVNVVAANSEGRYEDSAGEESGTGQTVEGEDGTVRTE